MSYAVGVLLLLTSTTGNVALAANGRVTDSDRQFILKSLESQERIVAAGNDLAACLRKEPTECGTVADEGRAVVHSAIHMHESAKLSPRLAAWRVKMVTAVTSYLLVFSLSPDDMKNAKAHGKRTMQLLRGAVKELEQALKTDAR